MNEKTAARFVYVCLTLSIALNHVWYAFKANYGAFSPTSSALQQSGIFLAPLAIVASHAFTARPRHIFLISFYALTFFLMVLAWIAKSEEVWVYQFTQLPLFCVYALMALVMRTNASKAPVRD